MSRNNTGNPIESMAFADFMDNVRNLELISISELDWFRDRLGNVRLTWAGIEKAGTGNPGEIVRIVSGAVQDVVNGVDGQVLRAEDAADRSEASAIASLAGSRAYENPAAGVDPVSGVVNGALFLVRTQDPQVYDVYLNSGGSAVLQSGQLTVASTLQVESIQEYGSDTREALNLMSGLAVVEPDADVIDLYLDSSMSKSLARFDKGKGEFQFLGVPTDRTMADVIGNAMLNVPWTEWLPLWIGGEGGLWYDIQDRTTLFQDLNATIPAEIDGPLGVVLDKSGNGNHLTLVDAVLREERGVLYIEANGTSTYGTFNPHLISGVESCFVSMGVRFEAMTGNKFPLFISTDAPAAGGTRLALGLFNSAPELRLYARRLDNSPVAFSALGDIESGTDYVASGQVIYSPGKIESFKDGVAGSTASPSWGAGVSDGDPSAQAGLFRGPGSAIFFSGRLYSLIIRSPGVSDVQRRKTDEYVAYKMERQPEPLPAEINIFIVAGQSNAEGREFTSNGPVWLQDNIVDGVQVWSGGGLEQLSLAKVGPSGNGHSWVLSQSVGRFSFAHIALKEIAEQMSNVVACTVTSGGTSIAPIVNERGSWCPNFGEIPAGTPRLLEDLESRIIGLLNWCGQNGVTANVRGILWHQGERDSISGAPPLYYDRFSALVDRIRNAVEIPNLPILYGTIPTASLQYNAIVEQAQNDFAAADANAYCRDNSTLPLLEDGLHFDATGCVTFGQWAATTALSVIGD